MCAVDAGKDCTEVVKKAFEKTLAIAKVGMECKLKASELAQKNSDANTHFFLGCFAEQQVRASESIAHLTHQSAMQGALCSSLVEGH